MIINVISDLRDLLTKKSKQFISREDETHLSLVYSGLYVTTNFEELLAWNVNSSEILFGYGMNITC